MQLFNTYETTSSSQVVHQKYLQTWSFTPSAMKSADLQINNFKISPACCRTKAILFDGDDYNNQREVTSNGEK